MKWNGMEWNGMYLFICLHATMIPAEAYSSIQVLAHHPGRCTHPPHLPILSWGEMAHHGGRVPVGAATAPLSLQASDDTSGGQGSIVRCSLQ